MKASSISFIDGLINTKNNLHEFKAIKPTFFIDILFPDYDKERECIFYDEVAQID